MREDSFLNFTTVKLDSLVDSTIISMCTTLDYVSEKEGNQSEQVACFKESWRDSGVPLIYNSLNESGKIISRIRKPFVKLELLIIHH